jgi:hypothetical protein
MGKCSSCLGSLANTCQVCVGDDTDQKCLLCEDQLQYFTECVDECPLGYEESSDVPNLCVPSQDDTTESSPATYIVRASPDTDEEYSTLHEALCYAWQSYVDVLLADSTLELTKVGVSQECNILNPLYRRDKAKQQRIKVRPYDCVSNDSCSKAQVNLVYNERIYFNFNNIDLEISHVVFDGSNSLALYPDQCSPGLCNYCPSFDRVAGATVVVDDRGIGHNVNEVSYSTNCSPFNSLNFITVRDKASLRLRSVDFNNFRQQFNSLINADSTDLSLHDTSFSNVQTSPSQVILAKCTEPHSSKCTVTYDDGTVTLLNNGYEFKTDISQHGFMAVKGYYHVSLSNLRFSYNIILVDGTSTEALIAVSNTYNQTSMSSLTFNANISTGSLIDLDYKQLAYTSIAKDYSTGQAIEFSQTHIKMRSLTFNNNSVAQAIYYQEDAQGTNIKAQRLTFDNNVASNAMLYFEKTMALKSIEKVGGNLQTKDHKGVKVSVQVNPYSLILQATFKKSLAANGLIYVVNRGLVNIKDSLFSEVQAGDVYSQATVAFPALESNHKVYYSIPKEDLVLCSNVLNLSSVYAATVANSKWLNYACTEGWPGASSKNIGSSVTFTSLQFQFLSGKNAILTAQGNALTMTACEFIDNTAANWISADNLAELHILNTSFKSSSIASIGIDVNSNVLTMDTVTVADISGSGTVLRLTTPLRMQVTLRSVAFSRLVSSATLTAIFAMSGTQQWNWADVKFENFKSESKSVLFVAEAVTLESSTLDRMVVKGIKQTEQSALQMHLTSANLTISNAEFSDSSVKTMFQIGLKSRSQMLITSSSFTGITGSPVLYLSESSAGSMLTTSHCVFSKNTATALQSNIASWTDIASTFQENTMGAVIGTLSVMALTGTKFLSNTNLGADGGALRAIYETSFSCTSCEFNANSASIGGAVRVGLDSLMTLSRCTFTNNRSKLSGAAFFILNTTKANTVTDCTFLSNISDDGIIEMIETSLTMTRTVISKNSSGLIVNSSVFTCSECTFSDQAPITSAAFVWITSYSVVVFSSTTFARGSANDDGGGLFVADSAVTMNKCTVTDVASKGNGGFMWMQGKDSSIYITDSSFKNLSSALLGSFIYLAQGSIEISGTQVKAFSDVAIYASQASQLIVHDCSFSEGRGTYGSCVACLKCKAVSVLKSSFEDNYSTKSGAAVVLVEQTSLSDASLLISGCSFTNNTAPIGGAVQADSVKLEVKDSTFTRNSANSSNGGAMSLSCLLSINCVFKVSGSSFTQNTAEVNGGALAWAHNQPILSANSFTYNKAKYGADLASFPMKLSAVDEYGELVEARRLSEYIWIASGQNLPEPVRIALVDHYGQVVRTDNSSAAEMSAENSIEVTLTGQTKVSAEDGIFVFDSLVVSATPGTSISLSVETSSIDVKGASSRGEGEGYSSTLQLNFETRLCQSGEALVKKDCLVCKEGTYSLTPDQPCTDCPSEAICYGNMTMAPKAGYWRSNIYTDTFYACPNTDACVKPSSSGSLSLIGECAKGYQGNMCHACSSGYSRSSENKCGTCPDISINALRLACISLVVVIVCGVMVRSTLRTAYEPKKLHSIYIKIFMNYLQLVLLTTQFKLEWPEFVQDMFFVQKSAATVTDQAFSFDCYLEGNSSGESTGDQDAFKRVFYNKLLMTAFLPPLLGLVSLGVWGGVYLVKRQEGVFRKEMVATIVILFFLVHPSIVRMNFDVFSCREIDSGEYWLVSNLDIRCWDSLHTFYASFVALPCILVWGLGVPTLILLYMHRNRRELDFIVNRLRFGFLYNGFRKNTFYWEIIILYRKISVICCAVFLGTISIPVQALTVMIILLFCLYIQYKTRPYTHPDLNELETRGLLVATVTIYCGLYYLTDDIDQTTKLVLFTVIIVANALFLIFWLVKIFEAFLLVLAASIDCLKRFVRLDSFNDASIINDAEVRHSYLIGEEKFMSLAESTASVTAVANLRGLESVEDYFIDVARRNCSFKHKSDSAIFDKTSINLLSTEKAL